MRRISRCSVKAERQTNYHCLRVKAFAEPADCFNQVFPVRAGEWWEWAHRQTQFIRNGDPDAARAEVKSQQATRFKLRRNVIFR